MHFNLYTKNDHKRENPTPIEWDPKAGTLKGEGKEYQRLLLACEEAKRLGYVIGEPYPTEHPVDNPFLSKIEMAYVLSSGWQSVEEVGHTEVLPASTESSLNATY